MTESITLSTSNLIESNYKLSLKFFMNKNFNKSFEILKNEYQQVFHNLQSGIIQESSFIKILNLYLTEIGLMTQSNDFKINKNDKNLIIQGLKDDYILNKLMEIYKDINLIPSEIIFNLYVTNYMVLDINETYTKFIKLYGKIDFLKKKKVTDSGGNGSNDDKFLKKLIELFVLKILPKMNLINDAKQIINENPILDNKSLLEDKLIRIERENELEFEKQKNLKYQKVRDQKKKEEADKLEKDLKYKSLKQIKEASVIETSGSARGSTSGSPNGSTSGSSSGSKSVTDFQRLTGKLMYHYNLTKSFLQHNSPMLLLTLVLLIIISRILKVKKINLGQTLKETLQMAFKISYL